jgi:hypothetical protein
VSALGENFALSQTRQLLIDRLRFENLPSIDNSRDVLLEIYLSLYLYIKVLLFFYISIYGHIRTDLGFSQFVAQWVGLFKF